MKLEGEFDQRPKFLGPARSIEAANFGRVTSTQDADQDGSRTIQVGLRYAF